jgi:hypothetical protein
MGIKHDIIEEKRKQYCVILCEKYHTESCFQLERFKEYFARNVKIFMENPLNFKTITTTNENELAK